MKKVLIVVLFSIGMDAWSQSPVWYYDLKWVGVTNYIGSGKAQFEDKANSINNNGKMRKIERSPKEQIDIIRYGLTKYEIRSNDVYAVAFVDPIARIAYMALAIITDSSGGFSFYAWKNLFYEED